MKKIMIRGFLVTCLLSGFLWESAVLAGEETGTQVGERAPAERAPAELAFEKVYPALVRIYVVFTSPRSGRMERRRAAGSGAIISSDGYVVTNHHVAGNATSIRVTLATREEIRADLVGTDPLSDIAVLKLRLEERDNPNVPLAVAHWGDSDGVRVGDVVFAMGSPAAVSQSVTKGIVANTELILPEGLAGMFVLDGENVGSLVRWIAHDAVIFGGNSGGPLVDENGLIIGINEIGLGSLGGAIPGNLAQSVAEQIIGSGEVKRSWSGVAVQPLLKGSDASHGILVASVIPDSPAEAAGIRAGDIITDFDGVAVQCRVAEELPLFNQLVLGTPVGKTVVVGLMRDGQKKSVRLTTDARERMLARPEEIKNWGITARNITRMMALEHHRPSPSGVLVDSVRPSGPCAEAKPGLKNDDLILTINGETVQDIAALREMTNKAIGPSDTPVSLRVGFARENSQMLTVIQVGRDPSDRNAIRARKPWIGAQTQVLTRDLAESLGVAGQTGVRISELYAGRAADQAGLQVGDLIVAVDKMRIDASQPEDEEVFPTMIRQYKIGSQADLKVIRDGKTSIVSVTLEEPPKGPEQMDEYVDETFEFTVRDLTFFDRSKYHLNDDLEGVLVAKVETASASALAGLKDHDVMIRIGDRPTPNAQAVEAIMTDALKNKPAQLVFFVQRGIRTIFVELEPDWQDLHL